MAKDLARALVQLAVEISAEGTIQAFDPIHNSMGPGARFALAGPDR
jgi:hypothetical protein